MILVTLVLGSVRSWVLVILISWMMPPKRSWKCPDISRSFSSVACLQSCDQWLYVTTRLDHVPSLNILGPVPILVGRFDISRQCWMTSIKWRSEPGRPTKSTATSRNSLHPLTLEPYSYSPIGTTMFGAPRTGDRIIGSNPVGRAIGGGGTSR